jgi:hypothetical protein
MLTHKRLKELLQYNPRTGVFTWLVNGRNQYQHKGKKAGGKNHNGHITIGIDGGRFLASRLAIFWMTGKRPPNLVDHANCDPADNRWSNLRLATYSENLHNMRMKNNKVGLKGVDFNPATGRYRARIKVNYYTLNLGRFDTAEEAHAAYIATAKKYSREFARAR